MTLTGDYDHFVKMLIDVDLFKPLLTRLCLRLVKIVSFPLWIMRTFWLFVLLTTLLIMWPRLCHRACKIDLKYNANDKGSKETKPSQVQNVYRPKDKPNEAQKDDLEVQNITRPALLVIDPEALQTLFRNPQRFHLG